MSFVWMDDSLQELEQLKGAMQPAQDQAPEMKMFGKWAGYLFVLVAFMSLAK